MLHLLVLGAILATAVVLLLMLRAIDSSMDICVYVAGNTNLTLDFDTQYSLMDLVVAPGSDEVRTKSQALGAVYIPSALPDELVDRARADITRQILNPEQNFSHIALTGFRKEEPLRLTPAIMEVVERTTAALRPAFELLEDDAVMVELTGNYAWPGAMPQRVHDDVGLDTRTFDEQTIQLTAFVYLDDIGPKQSPTMFFPDDHHRLISDIDPEEFEALWGVHKLCEGRPYASTKQIESFGVEAVVPKGTLALYNNNMMHGGTENHSRKVRPAMVLTYGRSYEKMDASQTWGIDASYFNRITLRDVLETIDSKGSKRCYPTKGGRVETEKIGVFANLTSAMTLAREVEQSFRLKAQPETRQTCRDKLRQFCGHKMDEGDSLGCLSCAANYYFCCGDPSGTGSYYSDQCRSGRASKDVVLSEGAWCLRHVLELVEPDKADAELWHIPKLSDEELMRFTQAIIAPSVESCPLNQPCMWPAIERECKAVVFSDRPYAEMYETVRSDGTFRLMDIEAVGNVYVDGIRALLDPEAFYTFSRLVHYLFGADVRRAYVSIVDRLYVDVLRKLASLPLVSSVSDMFTWPGDGQRTAEADSPEARAHREVDLLMRVDPLKQLPTIFEGLGSPLSLLEFGNYTLTDLMRPLEPHEFVPILQSAC